jgi:hypothetical protein
MKIEFYTLFNEFVIKSAHPFFHLRLFLLLNTGKIKPNFVQLQIIIGHVS